MVRIWCFDPSSDVMICDKVYVSDVGPIDFLETRVVNLGGWSNRRRMDKELGL